MPADSESDSPVPDSPDPGKTPREPDAPEGGDVDTGAEGPDKRQRQVADNVRYREVVDTAYQVAATDAWAEAVPKLRAAWEQHQEKYPERDRAIPETRPDGSWVAEGNRRLSAEQNAEASKCCADLRGEAHKVILPAMQRVEAAESGRHLAGLENMLKGEDRLKEKIATAMEAPGVTVREALDLVPDGVRFTLKYTDTERYADGVLADVELLKSEGFELVKLKNLWHSDQYKGVNSQWCRPDTGLRFEVQFHTPQSLEAKELTHEAYKRIRSKTAPDAEQRELREFQRRANALLATPPGTDRIRDFPE